jgi:arylsulfatase A-like enzyme
MRIALTALGLAFAVAAPARSAEPAGSRPNVIFILIDDLGYGDLGCTGNKDVPTPNIDRLAAEGTLFTRFYVASPVCSPSRVAFTTGQYPARRGFHSYLAAHAENQQKDMPDWLDPAAPSIARSFQQAGYATAHIGKWHMGGGRDVGEAPLPQAYGFDESLTSFEGLGDRILPPGPLSEQSAELGRGEIRRVAKTEMTGLFVDTAITFIQRHTDAPFLLHLWLDDVHDPHEPTFVDLTTTARPGANPYQQRFEAVLIRMDEELGRLFDALETLDLSARTLVLLTGDNGPTAWPRYYREGFEPPGSTGGLRGRKWSLYEGGIREPLIARWPGRTPAGAVDDLTLISAVDLFPTLAALAGIDPPDAAFDGMDRSEALLGRKPGAERTQPLFWEYGRDNTYLRPGNDQDRSPDLAVRDGRWKLLMNADGSWIELYDMEGDPGEQSNLAAQEPDLVQTLSERLLAWRRSLGQEP